MAVEVISIPKSIADRIRKRAEQAEMSLEEYVIELLLQDVDPRDRVKDYVEASLSLLEEARIELSKGNIRQAAEKTWGAVALAVKAYALWRDGKRLTSHGELWEYIDKLSTYLGDWVRDSWNAGQSMHVCFYEGWCTPGSIEAAIGRVERLVREVGREINQG